MCSCLSWSNPVSVPEETSHHNIKKGSLTLSQEQSKDLLVKIVHAGGRVELYPKPVHVSILTQKYPGMCVARPNVFKEPHESVLSSDEFLSPGNKYFIVRCTTVEKLKRRSHSSVEEMKKKGDISSEDLSVCSGDFAVSKDNWSVLRKHVKERGGGGGGGFVKPIQSRPSRVWKECEWEPSLTSIKEVSP